MKIGIFTAGIYPVSKETIKATEYFSFELAERLSKRGHDVHLFAAEGSMGNFKLVTPRHSFDIHKPGFNMPEYGAYNTANFCDFIDYCNDNKLDIIHDQTTAISIALSRYAKMPVLSTLHGIREQSSLSDYYQKNRFMKIVAISESAKLKSPDLEFYKTIYHGIDPDEYLFNPTPTKNFLSLGRIMKVKGQMDAIEATEICGETLDLAGYCSEFQDENEYYLPVKKRAEQSANVVFLGKAERQRIPALMANARALLMPIYCYEAFGLVMIEAMISGTPVIAYDIGSVREIIKEGETGFIVPQGNIYAMAEAMKKIDEIDRQKCRDHVVNNFNINRMVDEYEQTYGELIGGTDGH